MTRSMVLAIRAALAAAALAAAFSGCAARTEADAAAAQPLGRAFSAERRDQYTDWTDLHHAAALNLPAAVAALVEAGVDPDVRLAERAWLPAGVSPWPRELADLGLKGAFAGWEADGETPAMIAARTNSVSALAELVARGAELDADALLIHAAAGNAPDAVEWLIARGADIHAGGGGGGTPLHRAAAANAVDAAALLVARGADVDAKNGAGRTPLHRAARRGALGAAEFLVARGADIDAGNGAGETPLHEAARDDWDDWSVAEFLAGRGADVDARGRSGRTPLHYAAWWRSDDLARILVDRGAEVDARDRDGAAPLHYAAQYGSLETAKLLIDRGADVDAGNGAGETPLFGAARRGALDVAALLVDRGADVDATDAWGRTPQDAAFERDRPDIAEWFAERGGTPAESRPEAARAPVEASRFAPGASFRDCAHCPEMVAVPAGRFTMGSPPAEEGRGDDEGPRRIVDFPAPFAVGVHEVTRGEFARFAAATNRATWDPSNPCVTWGIRRYPMLIPNEEELGMGVGPRWRDPGFIQSDGHPAVCVSWSDAHAYAEWLSQETGREYRLLSESEWEYAARAGTTAARYWRAGEAGQCRHANGADLSAHAEIQGAAECDDGYAYTSPVGSFGANAWGLHDVLGNVWEWTRDCATGGYASSPSGESAANAGECAERVLRGGSWYDRPETLRAANRFAAEGTGYRADFAGFRVARTIAP